MVFLTFISDHIGLAIRSLILVIDLLRQSDLWNTFLVLVRSFTKSPICNIDLCIGYKLGPIFFWQVQINLFLFAENNVVVNFFSVELQHTHPLFGNTVSPPFVPKMAVNLKFYKVLKVLANHCGIKLNCSIQKNLHHSLVELQRKCKAY